MAFNFKKIAQQSLVVSSLMEGKTKFTTNEVVNRDWTVVQFDLAPKFTQSGEPIVNDDGEPETYGVVVFAEAPDRYYTTGTVFTKVIRQWAIAFNGDCKQGSTELEASGGVRVRFSRKITRSGNTIVNAEIL